MTPDGPVTVPSIHYLPNSSSPVSSLTDIQCLEYLSFGSPEDWIDNTAIISYRSQTLIWVHKSYLEMSLKILIFLIIIAISFIGNYLILIVMIKFKNSRNCTNLFICNMAIADLMTTLFSAWTSLQENLFQNYTLGPVFCKIETSSKVLFLITSIFSLTWISCDRLIGIIRPFRNPMKRRKAWFIMGFIWFLSFIIGIPFYFWREYRTREWCDYFEVWCKTDGRKIDVYMFVLLAFMVYIPLFIMTFSYCLVIAKMKSFETKISTDENSIKIKHRRKVILMLFIYLITSAICWSPLQVVVFYRFIALNSSVDSVKPWNEEAKFWAQVFASANSALNPLIYGITNGSFRKAICLLYPKLSWFLRLDTSSRRRVTNNGEQLALQTRARELVKSTFTMSNYKKKKNQPIKTISGQNVEMAHINGLKDSRR
ncbi:neuropeptide Y receptor type 2 [Tetranychus urticae]|uniref:G-protein coupled receptors family 1 profile domain-containing protein n=1 Tax=Tetranychus urticae TaxID=32264 RepID=T1K3R5_TETUR|nr:neuropeptide Y receptor type 2 [Tetranychus urticae]